MLVVVDLAVVDAPRAVRGQPLPVLEVPREAIATELPDLAESWAWAHAQAVAPVGGVDLAAELTASPALNVSRIVAPRRLEPSRRYAACLVPAFDAGVARGLGAVPDASAPLGPAWPPPGPGDLDLPVYFHWEFATGPRGDFESLARRLQPFRAPADIGVERMYIGAAGPELPAAAPDAPGAILEMDGALRSPQRTSGALADVPEAVRDALRTALDAAATQAAEGADERSPALGPPLYGAFHAGQHTIPAELPAWLRELNLDPRARAAAGLGAEIERANQEDFMQWCWEQVGRILEANRLMSRARLSLEVLARLHERHVATLPPDRLFALAAPLHARTRQDAATVAAAVARSSLADAAGDPAMRRLISPARPVLRAALKRASATAPGVAAPRVRLVAGLAAGSLEVDPTQFVPDGLLGTRALSAIAVPAQGDQPVSLAAAGLDVSAPASQLRRLRGDAAAATITAPRIVARGDLRTTGVLLGEHLAQARGLVAAARPGASLFAELGTMSAGTATTAQPLGPIGPRGPLGPIGPRGPLGPIGPRGPLGPIEPVDPTDPTRPPRPREPVRDIPTIRRLERSLAQAMPGGRLGDEPPARAHVTFDLARARTTIVDRTDPRATIPLRLGDDAHRGRRSAAVRRRAGRADASPRPPIASWQRPSSTSLSTSSSARLDPERFLPGVGAIPEEAITVLETNPRFVEALLVGLNARDEP